MNVCIMKPIIGTPQTMNFNSSETFIQSQQMAVSTLNDCLNSFIWLHLSS